MILGWLYRLILLGKSNGKKYIQEWCKHAGCSTMLFMMQRIIHMGDNKHTGIPKMMRPGMRCCHGLMSLTSLVSLKSLTSLMPTCEASDFCWWYVLLRLPIWGQATWTISWVSLGLCAVCPWPLFFQLLHITFSSRSCDNENVCYAAVMQQLCIKLPRAFEPIWSILKHFVSICELVLLFMVLIQGSCGHVVVKPQPRCVLYHGERLVAPRGIHRWWSPHPHWSIAVFNVLQRCVSIYPSILYIIYVVILSV
jgi:hypothetical protein